MWHALLDCIVGMIVKDAELVYHPMVFIN